VALGLQPVIGSPVVSLHLRPRGHQLMILYLKTSADYFFNQQLATQAPIIDCDVTFFHNVVSGHHSKIPFRSSAEDATSSHQLAILPESSIEIMT
jgi:hypothetical protein